MILARDQSQKFSIFPRNTNVGGVFASSLANLSTFEQSNVSSSNPNETRISRNLGGENVLTSHARSIGDRGKVNRRQRLEWLEKPIARFAETVRFETSPVTRAKMDRTFVKRAEKLYLVEARKHPRIRGTRGPSCSCLSLGETKGQRAVRESGKGEPTAVKAFVVSFWPDPSLRP